MQRHSWKNSLASPDTPVNLMGFNPSVCGDLRGLARVNKGLIKVMVLVQLCAASLGSQHQQPGGPGFPKKYIQKWKTITPDPTELFQHEHRMNFWGGFCHWFSRGRTWFVFKLLLASLQPNTPQILWVSFVPPQREGLYPTVALILI